MKDLVLNGFVNNYAEGRALTGLPDSEVFESFAASCVLRKYHQSNITDIEEEVLVGGTQDGGIDAVAILVNGRPVQSEEDVEAFIEAHGRLEVEFVFIQAKTSPNFRSGDIGSFLVGVEQFFQPQPRIPFSDALKRLAKLSRSIFLRSIHMEDNPKCCLYYVTSGLWNNPAEVTGRITLGQDQIKQLNLFSSVRFIPVDSELLKTIYRELERGVTKAVEFSKTAVFPRIDGVNEAYIGLMPGDEFIKLVSTDDGELNRDLFYDNVRDFQGRNPVNREIHHTLSDDQLRDSFPLLNNGVTIVSKKLNRTGDTFTLSDFQIVNGCQTTHILFRNRAAVNSNTFIPIKLVATSDSQVVTDVIKATNRQTQVLPEALESLTPFHRELEDFYTIQERKADPKTRVYYERRSKQYSMDRIHPSNIVTLTTQVKSFVAMFLNEPHSHPRYYGELLKAYQHRLFVDDHKPAPYYASGVALLIVDKLFNSDRLDRNFRRYKHHMLMLVRMQIGGHDMPRLDHAAITNYSLRIVSILRDPQHGYDECARALDLIKDTLTNFRSSGSNLPDRLREFTRQLSQSGQLSHTTCLPLAGDRVPQVGEKESGRIKYYNEWKNFGFIDRDAGGDIFVHAGELQQIPWRLLIPGTQVQYQVAKGTEGRTMASNVTVKDGS